MPRTAKKPTKRRVSDAHKAAMAEGRVQGAAVKRYLQALEEHKPRRGRKRTPESIERRLETIAKQLPEAGPLQRLLLIQERMDLTRELSASQGGQGQTPAELEDEFVAVAKDYGERRGISYAAWRELGVPASALKRAGIGRGRT